jgi:hypothetical protein
MFCRVIAAIKDSKLSVGLTYYLKNQMEQKLDGFFIINATISYPSPVTRSLFHQIENSIFTFSFRHCCRLRCPFSCF